MANSPSSRGPTTKYPAAGRNTAPQPVVLRAPSRMSRASSSQMLCIAPVPVTRPQADGRAGTDREQAEGQARPG